MMTRDELLGRIGDILRRSGVADAAALEAELGSALYARVQDGEICRSFRGDIAVPAVMTVHKVSFHPASLEGFPSADSLTLAFFSSGIQRAEWPMPRYGIPVTFEMRMDPHLIYNFIPYPKRGPRVPVEGLEVTLIGTPAQ